MSLLLLFLFQNAWHTVVVDLVVVANRLAVIVIHRDDDADDGCGDGRGDEGAREMRYPSTTNVHSATTNITSNSNIDRRQLVRRNRNGRLGFFLIINT